ncbi:MAG: phage portal protein [Cetobacterium sp.]
MRIGPLDDCKKFEIRLRNLHSHLMFTKAKQWLLRKAVDIVADDPDWFRRQGFYRLAALQDGRTDFGFPSVSDLSALQIGAFYCCAKVLSEDIGMLPFPLLQRTGKELRKAEEHTLYEVLHDLPNPETSKNTFVETMTAHAAVCGTGYAQIARDRGGRVRGLYIIMPGDIERHRNEKGHTFYAVKDRGKWEDVPRTEIFDLPGFSWTGSAGNRVADFAQATLGLAIAQEQYAANFFSRDHTPGVVLSRPREAPSLSDEAVEKMKAAWRKMVNSHDVAVLQEGTNAQIISKSNTESQLLEQRIHQVRNVAMWFRMPAYKLGDMDRMTWGNVGDMRIEYVSSTLKPWNERWSGSVYRCLLTPDERRAGYYAEHSTEAFMRGDFLTQTTAFRSMLAAGVFSPNEVRAWLNLNPVEGGDARFIQVNMQNIVDAATGAAMQDQSGRVQVGGQGGIQ